MPAASPSPSWATKRSPERRTFGPAVARLAERMGRPFMPWQQQVADTALEVDAQGRYCYRLVVVTVPRQSGKTTLFSAVGEHRALVLPGGRVWYTMQTGQDARDWFLNEHVPLLTPFDGQLTVYRGAGSERARWRSSGGIFRPFPPRPDALHGKTSDLVVVDEAWAFDPDRGRDLDQAIVPTQATRPGAQVWKLSTAGTDLSTWLLSSLELGRKAVQADRREGLAYFEWSCPEDLDPCQPASWPRFHPALGRTISADAMSAALELLGPDDFARAYGNRWIHTGGRIIPLDRWLGAADLEQQLPRAGGLVLAFDVALDRSDAAIVACWRGPDGAAHLEVSDRRPGARGGGAPGAAAGARGPLAAAGDRIRRIRARARRRR